MDMSLLEGPPRRLTVEEYEQMGVDECFDPDVKVELLNGQIFTMSPVGFRHACAVDDFLSIFFEAAKKRYVAGTSYSLLLDGWSEPQPDLMLINPRVRELGRHPKPADVFLTVEVSDSTLQRDRRVKAPAYAQQGILEYWILNLVDNQLEVYQEPKHGEYQVREVFMPDQTVAPLAFRM